MNEIINNSYKIQIIQNLSLLISFCSSATNCIMFGKLSCVGGLFEKTLAYVESTFQHRRETIYSTEIVNKRNTIQRFCEIAEFLGFIIFFTGISCQPILETMLHMEQILIIY